MFLAFSCRSAMNIVLLSSVVATVMSSGVFQPNVALDQRWQQFKVKHGKEYNDAAEELKRRQIWEGNIQKIEKHNAEFKMGKTTFTMGENQFADKTSEEMKRFMGNIPRSHEKHQLEDTSL